jgi:hypothetical protein
VATKYSGEPSPKGGAALVDAAKRLAIFMVSDEADESELTLNYERLVDARYKACCAPDTRLAEPRKGVPILTKYGAAMATERTCWRHGTGFA